MNDLGNWLWGKLSEGWTWLTGTITGFGAWLVGKLSSGWDFITTKLSEGWNWLSAKVYAVRDWLGSQLSNAQAWLSGKISEGNTWLKSGIDGLGSWLRTNVSDPLQKIPAQVGSILGGTINNLIAGLLKPLQDLWAWIVNNVTWAAQTIAGFVTQAAHTIGSVFQPFIKTIVDGLTHSFSPGSPDPELNSSVNVWIGSMMAKLEETAITAYGSPPQLAQMPTAAISASAAVSVAALIAEAVATAADTAHPIKQIGIREIVREIIGLVGLGTVAAGPIVAMYDSGMMRPLRYYYNTLFAPDIPGPGDLVKLAVSRAITGTDYVLGMRMNGFNTEWATTQLNAAYKLPGSGDIGDMVNRGYVGTDKYAEALRFVGVREDFIAPMTRLLERVPGVGDLLKMASRDVITEPEMFEGLRALGYARATAEKLWGAHWRELSPGEINTAYHRGNVTRAERDALLKYNDYRPTARPGVRVSELEIVKGLSKYNLPYRQLGYAWDLGELDTPGLVDRFRKLGYEEDAELMASIAISRVVNTEMNRIRTELVTDFKEGQITEATFRANLAETGMGPDRIDYLAAYAKKRRDREYNTALLAYWKDAYTKDLLDDARLLEYAKLIIIDAKSLDLYLKEAFVAKYKKPKVAA